MSIEIVDSDAMEKEPKPASAPAPAPKPESEVEARQEPRPAAKRLNDIDAKLDRALSRLEQQVDKLHSLNARLFGASKATTENQKTGENGRNNGVIAGLDEKVAHFDALLAKLDAETGSVDTLA